MEENQNSGVDLSDYLNSPKKQVSSGRLSQEAAKKRRDRIYIAIIVVCLLGTLALWVYYMADAASY